MGKALLLAQLNKLSGDFETITGKIIELQSALEGLSATSTKITYLLNDEESIKATYHLAGKPYGEEATNEQKLLTDTSTKYETQKTDMMTKLQTKIDSLKLDAAGLRSGMNALSREIANTKED